MKQSYQEVDRLFTMLLSAIDRARRYGGMGVGEYMEIREGVLQAKRVFDRIKMRGEPRALE